jgi:hypothetical protein
MIINNKSDPLLKSGPPAGQVLLERFAAAANGFPNEAVVDAAVNVLINVIRQQVPKRTHALAYFDELFGKCKTVLAAHYDAVTGARRNIFAHTQHIVMDTHKDPEGL